MDIEASIAERLQKLKQWQIEQQEKLLKQQQTQREILSHEQDQIYKVFGLPIHEVDITEDSKNLYIINKEIGVEKTDNALMLQYDTKNLDNVSGIIDKEVLANSNLLYKTCDDEQNESKCISTIVDKNINSMEDYKYSILSQKEELNDSSIEGIKPLLSSNTLNKYVLIEDIPLSASKKDFQMLLEEKLKKDSEIMPSVHSDMKIKPKKPFLKKGQGLLRFKISTNLYPPTTKKKHSTFLTSNIHLNRNDKSKKSTIHKHVLPKTNVSVTNEKQQLNLNTVSLPKSKIINKSITPTDQIMYNIISNESKYVPEIKENITNFSKFDSKIEKELEEVRIFELLEEKAENSSFCSTSSTVLAFLQQSTPFKIKNRLNQAQAKEKMEKQNDEQTNDTVEQKPIVQQIAPIQNSKLSIQCSEQFDFHKHSHINVATDFYWDTKTVDNVQKEVQDQFISVDQELQNNEAYVNNLKNHDTSVIAILSNDEKRNISENDHDLYDTYDNGTDGNHRVRFSEYNECRTIDISDMTNNPSLKDYFEQNSNDHSVDTETESNVEKLSFNYEEQINNSFQKNINEKIVDISNSLQQDTMRYNKKDSYNYIRKTIHVPKEINILSCENQLSDEDMCSDKKYNSIMKETDHASNEEQSILSSPASSSSSLSLSNQHLSTYKKTKVKRKPEKITEKIAKIYLNTKEIDPYSFEEQMNKTDTFETEILKSNLLELEKEIGIFRKESSALLLQRRKLQADETILHKKYVEKERNFEENKKRIQNQLENEKKKVARQKVAMENRIRDAQEKARQNKVERQKVQNLQEQLEQLRAELNIKESRWNAIESRYKSELRVLQIEISKLKQEIVNLQNIRKINVKNFRKSTGQVITKAINQINKRVMVSPKKSPIKMCQNLSDTLLDISVHVNNEEDAYKDKNKSIKSRATNMNNGFGQIEANISLNKATSRRIDIESQSECDKKCSEENVKKKRHLYENLLKDVTSDLERENQHPFDIKQGMLNDSQSIVTQIQNLDMESNDKSYFSNSSKEFMHKTDCATNNVQNYINGSHEVYHNLNENDIKIQDGTSLEKNLSSPSLLQNSKTKNIVKQIQYSDGHIEYWYPNGNIKKIFPDQEITKMIYYNGDVRETDKNGKIKYFYSITRTWHTTTPDGLEILEFPDGQVEKRMSDGTVEVLFPDGVIQLAQTDGTEKWLLPDGTIAQTFINGDKILTLSNGQREIHTNAHKRREYPDGTVKLVYTDGTQETRYSSGRKRLKDKYGNLLMDLYDV
ncbi:hypothetical protein P5V15_015842 [Pogonomyrmex californicus]